MDACRKKWTCRKQPSTSAVQVSSAGLPHHVEISAARYTTLMVLYLYEQKCLWNAVTRCKAAGVGNLPLLQRTQQQGAP